MIKSHYLKAPQKSKFDFFFLLTYNMAILFFCKGCVNMLSVQLCSNCEYCTDCPKRKDCAIRKLFYSDSEYTKWKNEALNSSIALSNLIFPDFLYFSAVSLVRLELMFMDRRKEKELQLYPTYSQD